MGRGPRLSAGLTPAGAGLSRRGMIAAGLALALPAGRAAQVQENPGGLPPFQALDLQGRKIAVPLPGKPTVVNFWATWCEPCRTEMPVLQQMADFYNDKLVLQAVNFKERAAAVQRHVQAAAWQVPVLLDPLGEGAAAWQVKIFPTTIGFDAQGKARWRVQGEFDWSGAEAGRRVEGLWR